ncbi:CAF17-like 4Fe-4S cluster assembly/insertion protein YgfZ [Alteromonas lipolytica]|uniref:tRNA-modifying protein YgfZ-like beta-barrel domain-containing protein n=1 Tax=Alteromonas lipolytica TaxID=1856405 RepID=A0A1E8F9C8_9ALTE|nr:hypothetical protein [Alteromonas lipolytica]OFI32522.1 hypothetical protein BFC17_04985 [Alteromonas lipolytica]GGF75467.1 tRNA-modifying protein YgfZ [Alteromonas lipolytica]
MQEYSPLPAQLTDLPANFAVALNAMACLSVTGDDAKTFLHSQLTIDVNKLAEHSVRRSAHCDFKGKSWSISLVANAPSAIYVLADKSALQASQEQFNKYGVFAKINIESKTDVLDYFLIQGESTKQALAPYFNALPDTPMTLTESACGFCVALDYPSDSLLVALEKDTALAFTATLKEHSIALFDETVATALEIAAGVPAICGTDHVNQYVPQMMNLQALNGIDFNKGCYMGQEVVARTRYLGKNKRAAMIFKLDGAVTDINGAVLEKQAGEHWRSGGTILRAAVLGNETWLLAIVNNDTTDADAFRLSSIPSSELIHCDLPYTL